MKRFDLFWFDVGESLLLADVFRDQGIARSKAIARLYFHRQERIARELSK